MSVKRRTVDCGNCRTTVPLADAVIGRHRGILMWLCHRCAG